MIEGSPEKVVRYPRTWDGWMLLSPLGLLGQAEVVPMVCSGEDHLTGNDICCTTCSSFQEGLRVNTLSSASWHPLSCFQYLPLAGSILEPEGKPGKCQVGLLRAPRRRVERGCGRPTAENITKALFSAGSRTYLYPAT